MKNKLGLLMVLILISSVTSINSNIKTEISYSDFYLNSDEVLGIGIIKATLNGSDGIPFPLVDPNDETTKFMANLSSSDNIGLGIIEIPDWKSNESDEIYLGGLLHGGHFMIQYPAPWTIDPNGIEGDGPMMFFPIIPIGDETYFTDLESAFTSVGYSVVNNITHFDVSHSNSSYTARIIYEKLSGLMDYYSISASIDTTTYEIEANRAWLLAPSKSSTLDWFSENPLIDYRILVAEQTNGSIGVPLEVGSNPEEPSSPNEAEGMFYPNQLMQTSITNIRNFEDTPGYWLEFSTETGRIAYNISINLPQAQPLNNSLYLYPMFPIADFELVQGYFGYSEIVADFYSHTFDGNEVTLNIDVGNVSFSATWFHDTGILNHWYLNDSGSVDGPGIILEFELLSAVRLEDLGIQFNAVVGQGITYKVDQLLVDGPNQMDFEEGTGYLEAGDLVYFEPVMVDSDFDNGPPYAIYDIVGENGEENGVTFNISYPTDMSNFEGPPFLHPHFLTGNSQFYDWLSLLYGYIGGSFVVNSTHMSLGLTMDVDNDSAEVNVIWRLSDGAMVYYFIDSPDEESEGRIIIELSYVDDGNQINAPTDTTTTTTGEDVPEIFLPVFHGYN